VALSSEEDEYRGNEHGYEGERDEYKKYGMEAFRRAIKEHQHSDGIALSWDIPRWWMSYDYLLDLFDYMIMLGQPIFRVSLIKR
jgi:hypothetical protein